jgi:hypothetical protein
MLARWSSPSSANTSRATRCCPLPPSIRTRSGGHRIAGGDLLVTSRQRLAHRRIVVAGLDAFDVEAAVIALLHGAIDADHAGRDGAFAHGMADVETLDATRRVGQSQRLLQCQQPPAAARSLPASEPARRVAHCSAPSRPRRAPSRFAAARIDALGQILDRVFAEDHARRHRLLRVMLLDKGRQALGSLGFGRGVWKNARSPRCRPPRTMARFTHSSPRSTTAATMSTSASRVELTYWRCRTACRARIWSRTAAASSKRRSVAAASICRVRPSITSVCRPRRNSCARRRSAA